MKKFILLSLFLPLGSAFAAAEGDTNSALRRPILLETSVIREFQMSPYGRAFNSGYLSIDYAKNTASLTLYKIPAPGTLRPVVVAVYHYKLDAFEISCGSKVYKGKPLGEGQGAIVISDHRTRQCKDFKRFKTEIHQILKERNLTIKNLFQGDPLKQPSFTN